MSRKYIVGFAAVVVLALAVWLVPGALAQSGSSSAAATPSPAATSGGTTHTCP